MLANRILVALISIPTKFEVSKPLVKPIKRSNNTKNRNVDHTVNDMYIIPCFILFVLSLKNHSPIHTIKYFKVSGTRLYGHCRPSHSQLLSHVTCVESLQICLFCVIINTVTIQNSIIDRTTIKPILFSLFSSISYLLNL